MIRPCCIDACIAFAMNAARVAMTDAHPGYRAFLDHWNSLTSAEMFRVRDALAERGITVIAGYAVGGPNE